MITVIALIGMIMLVGIVVKNGIILIDLVNHLRAAGMSRRDALLKAGPTRLRPILMTSIAFIAGVFPLVVSHGAGAEMRQAMGIAVFAGLIGVTLFGLFLTPVFSVVLMNLRWRKQPVAPGEHRGPA